MPSSKAELLQGTLDLLILKTLQGDPLHGYAITQRIQQRSEEILVVEEGSLYPCLYRMEAKGWIKGEWGKVGEQSPRQILFADACRTETARGRDRTLGTRLPRHHSRSANRLSDRA